MSNSLTWITRSAADAGGRVLATAIAPLGKLRDAKPLHPDGVILEATVEITDPAPELGVPLFVERGPIPCLARLSRAVGTPSPLPDVGGIAVRLRPQAAEGGRCDLLFASTGRGRVTRWLLAVRRDPVSGPLTTLLPMRSVSGPVQFVLEPLEAPPGVYELGWARPRGSWQPLGRLVLGDQLEPMADPPLRFDPIVNPLDGLTNYPAVTRLREPAYRLARRLQPLSPRRTAV